MRWFLIALAAWTALGAVLTVVWVGRPRKTITPGQAAFVVVLNSAIVVALIAAARTVAGG